MRHDGKLFGSSLRWCYRSGLQNLHGQAKLIAVDEQANHDIVHPYGFGETNRLAHQTFDPCSSCEMLALDLLRVALAGAMNRGLELPLVSTPIVCIVVRDTKGLKQCFQLYKDLVLAPTKDVRQDLPGAVINGMPEPARLLFLAHKAPHFVHFGSVHAL